MNPDVNKIFNKLKEDKVELSTEKVELSLRQVQKIINESKRQASFRDKVEDKIQAAKKELKSYVDDAKNALSEIEKNQLALVSAGGEIDKLKKDMAAAGITTAPLDARKDEIKDTYNFLSKVYSDLNRAVITATNI